MLSPSEREQMKERGKERGRECKTGKRTEADAPQLSAAAPVWHDAYEEEDENEKKREKKKRRRRLQGRGKRAREVSSLELRGEQPEKEERTALKNA